jgi:hypothetical protein
MRTILAAIAGSILGIIIKPDSVQSSTLGVTILVGVIFYIISYIIAKKMVGQIPKDKRRKLITNAIFAYIFMLFTFMIIIYTAINQHIV